MAWPESKRPLIRVLEKIDDATFLIRRSVQQVRDKSAAGTATRVEIIGLKKLLRMAEIKLAEAITGVDLVALRDYIRVQKGDPALNVAAEYQAVIDAAVVLRTWIHANIPTDAGSGAVLERVSNDDGTYTPITVAAGNPASVAFRDQADIFLATIG